MKTQAALSDLDAAKLANFRLREQLLANERELFFRDILTAYGNPDEGLSVGNDGRTLIRKPAEPKKRKK